MEEGGGAAATGQNFCKKSTEKLVSLASGELHHIVGIFTVGPLRVKKGPSSSFIKNIH